MLKIMKESEVELERVLVKEGVEAVSVLGDRRVLRKLGCAREGAEQDDRGEGQVKSQISKKTGRVRCSVGAGGRD